MYECRTPYLGACYPRGRQDHFWILGIYFGKHRLVWHHRTYEKPIYLVSNLEYAPDIMAFYKKRFSIETIFGDIKSRGFNLQKQRVKDLKMISNILIIVCLAFFIVFALAKQAAT